MGRLWDDPSAFVMRAMDIIDQNGFNATAHAQSWDRMTSEEQRQHAYSLLCDSGVVLRNYFLGRRARRRSPCARMKV